ncbi:hypothetical protein RCOM_1314020 [Ricinus communis]|uniref:DUF7648 domain-containing protein n=1 Tax=Ricinus communis TaxID=3988 RepID=B9RYV9_RICCO|nr:hypothetical protein RCOM_1314020 [Ricinus communis]
MSDEETGAVRVPVHRTLPGLINEIMSKGRRMTYEELCNAVLPHWHNLRKHNGERYAYSSPSQAVLDCLRNRHEWAQLVDRGPKTSSSRKRRKLDAEESEDIDFGKGRTAKEGEGKILESQREDVPKGKRKARKRRRLALQGIGIKEIRKRRKADMFTDDDSGPFSNSSEESLFSEEEVRCGGGGTVGSEASASSDEAGTIGGLPCVVRWCPFETAAITSKKVLHLSHRTLAGWQLWQLLLYVICHGNPCRLVRMLSSSGHLLISCILSHNCLDCHLSEQLCWGSCLIELEASLVLKL